MGSALSQRQDALSQSVPISRHPKNSIFKVIFIGDEKVGKTSLITRFTKNSFSWDTPRTEAVDYVRAVLPLPTTTPTTNPEPRTILGIWDSSSSLPSHETQTS
ncbi:hypothetical protein BDV12DRAFT_159371 [Aspergillus spectabilis]